MLCLKRSEWLNEVYSEVDEQNLEQEKIFII